MGLFSNYVDKKIKRIMSANGSFEYNQMMTPDRYEKLQDRFTRDMLINSVWYGGVDIELKKLYESDLKGFKIGRYTTDDLNYFWAQPTYNNIRKIHSGLPQLISEKMVDLLIGNGYEWSIYQDEEKTERDEMNEERLEYILSENDWESLLTEAIETESWGGGVAFKISIVKNYDMPILEIVQPDEYEPEIKYGRIVGDIFITYLTVGKTLYKHKEHYGVDESGAFIKNTVFKHVSGDWVAANIKDIAPVLKVEDAVFPNLKYKLSLYKPNKMPNSEFRGSKLGESDYAGSHGVFDAIDETLSAMIQEARDSKIKNFWPSNLLPIDPISKTQELPPVLKKDFLVYNGGIGENEKPLKPEIVQGELHSDKYLETYKKLLETAFNNAGLSPQTAGITGLESVSASEPSQELREKTSIRTREKKLMLWKPTLENLFMLLLMADDVRTGSQVGEYDIEIQFEDYKIQTLEDKTKIASAGVQSKTWDIRTAVEYIHPEKTEEEQILTVINIKIENGITAFTKEEEAVYRKFIMDVQEEQPTEQVTQETVAEDTQFEETEEEVIE